MDDTVQATHTTTTAIDPVCGMTVDPARTPHRQQHDGETYSFCSAGCAGKFAADPARYLGSQAATHGHDHAASHACCHSCHGAHHTPEPAKPVRQGAIYTCPMHPQIRQPGPGNCPICGMALEPEVATGEAAPNPELVDMTRRFWIGLAVTVPVVALEMGAHFVESLMSRSLSNGIQLVLATPVVLWAGWPFFVRAWQSLVTRNLNMFTLIAMGTGVAYVYSLFGTLAVSYTHLTLPTICSV